MPAVSLARRAAALVVALPVAAVLHAAPGELVVAATQLRQQVDPTLLVAMPDYTVNDLVFDGLLNQGPRGKVPGLATSWKVSPDGRQIDFELRKGVKFHNGDPFTAEDVKYTYETILRPGNTHSYRKAFVESIERIEVPDPHRLRLVLKQPWPAFFTSSRNGIQPIVPRGYHEKAGKGFAEKPVGTGPFRFVAAKAGEFSRFEANPDYWGGAPKVKVVTQRLVKEPFTLYAMLERGEADIVSGLTGALMDRARANPKARVVSARYSGTSGLYFSKAKFPEATDRRVRMAFAHAINRDEIARRMLAGTCEVATGIFTPATFGFLPGLKPIPYDPARAKALLAEGGVKPGREITYTLHTESFGSLPNGPQVLEAIAGNLEAIGFKVVREPVDTSGWLAMMRGKRQPAVFYGPSSIPDDGGETLEGWYGTTGVWTSGNISVPEYDQLFKAQLQQSDGKKREALLQEFAKLEDARREAVPLFWCHTNFVAGPRVKQWTPGVSSAYHYHFQSVELAN